MFSFVEGNAINFGKKGSKKEQETKKGVKVGDTGKKVETTETAEWQHGTTKKWA